MVVDAFLKVLASVLVWFIGLFPAWTVPPALEGFVTGTLPVWLANADELSIWFPVGDVGICAGLILGAWAVGAGVRIVRTILSNVTGGGGAS